MISIFVSRFPSISTCQSVARSIKVRQLSHYQFSWIAGDAGKPGTWTLQLVLDQGAWEEVLTIDAGDADNLQDLPSPVQLGVPTMFTFWEQRAPMRPQPAARAMCRRWAGPRVAGTRTPVRRYQMIQFFAKAFTLL